MEESFAEIRNKRRKIVKKKMVNSVLILASYQRGDLMDNGLYGSGVQN